MQLMQIGLFAIKFECECEWLSPFCVVPTQKDILVFRVYLVSYPMQLGPPFCLNCCPEVSEQTQGINNFPPKTKCC